MRSHIFPAVLGAVLAVVVLTMRRSPGDGNATVLRRRVVEPTSAELALERPITEIRLNHAGLDVAIKKLSELSGVEIRPNWSALSAAGVVPDRPVTLWARNLTLEAALGEIVRETERPIGFSDESGTIVLSSAADLGSHTFARCYAVGDLLRAPTPPWDEEMGIEYGRDPPRSGYERRAEELQRLLTETVAPDSWRHVGGSVGIIRLLGDRIFVVQTWENQRAIRRMLDQLAGAPLPPRPPVPTVDVQRWNEALRRFVPDAPDRVEAAMARELPELSIPSASLGDAIEHLAAMWNIDIVLDHAAVESNKIDTSGPVSLSRHDVTLAEALDELLYARRWPEAMGYGVERGVVVVSTQYAADRMMSTRVYAMRDWFEASLLAHPDVRRADLSDRLVTMLAGAVAPDSWRIGGGRIGSAKELSGDLVVTQTWQNHREVERVLNALRSAATTRPAGGSQPAGDLLEGKSR